MNKNSYDGQLRRQCFSMMELCEEQIKGCKEGLRHSIPDDVLKGIRKFILTGCGDSLLAAQTAVPAFQKYAGAFGSSFLAYPAIEVSRVLNLKDNPSACLVVAISASGSPARIAELLKRAGMEGCHTLLITNQPDSRAAEAAEYLLEVHTPAFNEPGPGLRNYYASLIGLFSLACQAGIAKGFVDTSAMDELFEAVRALTKQYAQKMEEIDTQAFETACRWKDVSAIEGIGDDTDLAGVRFILAKCVEAAGTPTVYANSEDWCHVNYFASDPQKIGTVVLSSSRFQNVSRIKETLHSASCIGRPVFYISDQPQVSTGENMTVVTIPSAESSFDFLNGLLNYIPGALLASYLAALHNETYFRGDKSPQRLSQTGNTIVDSEIVIRQEDLCTE